MVLVPGGTFAMGSDAFYPEEQPVRTVSVESLWIDEHPVTTAEFARFVDATGYVTVAERCPDPARCPGADPDDLVPGSLVFRAPPGPVPLGDFWRWWAWIPGASWRHPEGPGTTLGGRDQHPVTHVAYEDAGAFARWSRKRLPTEAEWEHAARGGLDGATYAWGDELAPGGRMMANTWHGRFPWENLQLDGFEGTSPVRSFSPNGYGLFDVTGNVWEWTAEPWTPLRTSDEDGNHDRGPSCCGPGRALPQAPAVTERVIKGGSHLCAPNYCLRYRPAARQGQAVDTSTSHIGLRCVLAAHPGA